MGNFFITTNVMFATGYCANTAMILFSIPKKNGLFDDSDTYASLNKDGYQANVSINSVSEVSTIQQQANQFTIQTQNDTDRKEYYYGYKVPPNYYQDQRKRRSRGRRN